MTIKLVQRKHARWYEVSGLSDIRGAKVYYGIKKGEIFNVYRGESTKEGCKWMGDLKYSLLNLIYG